MEIDITKEKKRFSLFLAEEDNTNIIFSGIFGIGKTYFIHKFFDNYSDYIPIYLTPVQYSVSSNEDIFEYIKVDILFELMKRKVDFEKTDFSFSACTQMYIMENIDRLIISLLARAEKLKYGTDIISSFSKLKTKLEKYKNDLNTDQHKDVLSFLSSNKEKIGSIYEDNAITELIRALVGSLKREDKQIILVIDDLDRIDPEHIFRILNILSVHENFYGLTEESKFGFDKTILICDIVNVRNIYAAKYGVNVDFNGYVDKFYSKEVFNFDNTYEIIKSISSVLLSVKHNSLDIDINDSNCLAYQACDVLLNIFIKNNKLNIRSLFKKYYKTFDNQRKITIGGKSDFASNYIYLNVFDFIRSLFSTFEDMEKSFIELKNFDLDINAKNNILSVFIILSDCQNNKFASGDHCAYDVKYNIGSIAHLGIANLSLDKESCEKIRVINLSEVIKSAFSNYKKLFS